VKTDIEVRQSPDVHRIVSQAEIISIEVSPKSRQIEPD
jgi:hypothetical protein